MYDLRSIFRRKSAKDLARPKGLPEADINAALGRDIIPTWFEDAMLAISNRLDRTSHLKDDPGYARFNSAAQAVEVEKNISKTIAGLETRPDCFYHLSREHTTFEHWFEENHASPLSLYVGLATDTPIRRGIQTACLAVVDIDHRDNDNVLIKRIDTGALGLIPPNSREEQMKALRVIGNWMDRIDRGETLNPYDCYTQMKTAVGLGDASRYSQPSQVNPDLEKIWQQQKPARDARNSQSASRRLKQLHAAMRRGKSGRNGPTG